MQVPERRQSYRNVVYRSQNLLRPDSVEILRIVDVALRRNALLELSGILYFDRNVFIQYLEGPEDGLNSLLASLERDPRHKIEWVRPLPEIEAPRFPGVEMAFYDGRRSDACPAGSRLGASGRDEPTEAVLESLLSLPFKRPVSRSADDQTEERVLFLT